MHVIEHELSKYNRGKPSILSRDGLRVPLLEGGDDLTQSDPSSQQSSTAQSVIYFIRDLLLSIVKGLKIMICIGFIIYFWTQTCVTRTKQFGVVHELSKQGYVKITYHHDRVSSDASFEHRNNGETDQHENEVAPPRELEKQFKIEAGDYLTDIVTDAEYAAEHPDWVDTDGNDQLHLSEDVYKAIKELINAEIGDKTFCLIIIFTISWANWN